MKTLLLHAGGDEDTRREPDPLPNGEDLIRDLELDTMFAAMADSNEFLFDVAKRVVLSSLQSPTTIRYRQQVLADCLAHPEVVRELYGISVEAVDRRRMGVFSLFRDNPDSNLSWAIGLLEVLVPLLRRLRGVADRNSGQFRSEAFQRFFAMILDELNDEYLDEVERHIHNLQPRRGVQLGAVVGRVGKSIDYRVLRPRSRSWRELMPAGLSHSAFSFQIAPRDDAGFRALSDMRERGINQVANALSQSAEHIRGFFGLLHTELAFYMGCLNLHERLEAKLEPTCMPVVNEATEPTFSTTGLYDVCLSLRLGERAIGNDVDAGTKSLVVITGANQGGKSTFLRSVGQAQLMMQCGMFVPATSFRANIAGGVFTHHKREEDPTMEMGKLEEELSRMSEIADAIGPTCLLLCNESFASTNEREGSEIGRQIVRAMTEAGIKIFYVTHLYDLAHGFEVRHADDVLLLRAERQEDGRRTFKLREGAPLATSFGEDLYRRIFETTDDIDMAHLGGTNP